MQYPNDPIDNMIQEIKGTTGILAKVLFAGFNLVFILIIGLLLVSNFAM